MNLLQMQKGSKQYGAKILFENAGFAINEGEHVGVIGPNGAGKTTLFKTLVQLEHLDSGELTFAKNLRIGYLEQESEWALDISSEDYLKENCSKPIWELKQIGLDLGLTEGHFASPLRTLSGGYRMRMKLLYLIGKEPNLMLLDEPTNFLDLESVLALEKFLQGYSGAFLLISHDREFLRRTTEYTLEVEGGDITKYPGTIDDYFEQKEQVRKIQEAQASNQELKRKSIQDFIDRFGAKATKAKQAQSKMKQLEKMEKIEIRDLPVRATIHIPEPIHTGKYTVTIENAKLGYDNKAVLENVSFQLERGAHLGVVGFNGAGKSTLLKSISQRLPLISGELQLGHQVTLGYFAQHVAEDLDLNDTVLGCLQKTAHPDIKQQEILNLAGSLLFSGESVYKKINVLSGGEKSRVALGQILLKRSPLLLMDEPTNHLDFETVEALTEALRSYAGTLIVVSHDRGFIGRVSNKILEIRDGKVEVYPGTYDDYLWSLENGALKQRFSPSQELSTKNRTVESQVFVEKFNYKDEVKKLNTLIRDCQKNINQAEAELNSLCEKRDQLNIEIISSTGDKARDIAKQLGQCTKDIELTENKMLEYMTLIEEHSLQLSKLRN